MQINLKFLALIVAIPLLFQKLGSAVRESFQRWQETQ